MLTQPRDWCLEAFYLRASLLLGQRLRLVLMLAAESEERWDGEEHLGA